MLPKEFPFFKLFVMLTLFQYLLIHQYLCVNLKFSLNESNSVGRFVFLFYMINRHLESCDTKGETFINFSNAITPYTSKGK